MKYLKSAICILLVCLMLTGCSFRMASSIDDLISPVSPFGDNADIQKAMDSYAKNGYSLKVNTTPPIISMILTVTATTRLLRFMSLPINSAQLIWLLSKR